MKAHKFVSNGEVETYAVVVFCEHCGKIAFHGNNPRAEDMRLLNATECPQGIDSGTSTAFNNGELHEADTVSLSRWLGGLPRFSQRQDSLGEQLFDLQQVANRLGMYDAADFISSQRGKST